jgi:mannose-1-phosphate guanylyltransferase
MRESSWVLIMAGGGGTRLWPASRRRRPKQFLPLLPDGRSLLQATAERLRSVVPIERILVVTAASQVDDVRRAVPELPVENIVVEPQARNTAACIGLGAIEIRRRDPNAIIAVIPSDQHATERDRYRDAVQQAMEMAGRELIATVGIRPTAPETGYGYIEMGDTLAGARQVKRFVEKPQLATAQEYLRSGNYLWNSGMFFFRAQRILDAIDRHVPALGMILQEIARAPERTAELYPTAPSISIDYAVMEKLGAREIVVIPGDFGWNDVGSWGAIRSVTDADERGNSIVGSSVALDASGNVLYADPGKLVAVVGVNDLVVVAAGDSVLVMPKSRAQEVKDVIKALEASKRESFL